MLEQVIFASVGRQAHEPEDLVRKGSDGISGFAGHKGIKTHNSFRLNFAVQSVVE